MKVLHTCSDQVLGFSWPPISSEMRSEESFVFPFSCLGATFSTEWDLSRVWVRDLSLVRKFFVLDPILTVLGEISAWELKLSNTAHSSFLSSHILSLWDFAISICLRLFSKLYEIKRFFIFLLNDHRLSPTSVAIFQTLQLQWIF